jgi:hypothetical protein
MDKNALKDCIVCKESIKQGAQKCVNCDSFQDWRRYFSFGTVVLSLLVALFSVLAVAVPIIKSTLTPHRSDLRFSFLSYEPKLIKIVCSNVGNRAAILKEAKLYINQDGKEKHPVKTLMWERTDPIIRPNESRVISFYIILNEVRQYLPRRSPSDKSCQYIVQFEVIAFDHKPKIPRLIFSCPE